MTSQATPLEHAAAPKHFEPGTTGWTEEDLDQPEIDRAWHGGRYEIVRETKRRWYAAMGVRNYWILDAFARNLECLALRGADYHPDATGREADEVRPPAFPGLVIPLSNIWL